MTQLTPVPHRGEKPRECNARRPQQSKGQPLGKRSQPTRMEYRARFGSFRHGQEPPPALPQKTMGYRCRFGPRSPRVSTVANAAPTRERLPSRALRHRSTRRQGRRPMEFPLPIRLPDPASLPPLRPTAGQLSPQDWWRLRARRDAMQQRPAGPAVQQTARSVGSQESVSLAHAECRRA